MSKKNIMLVDDDKIFNFLSEKTITSLGLANEIHFALNGKQALELLEEYKKGNGQRPDIISMGLNITIKSCHELIEAIALMDRPDRNAMTVLVLTSSPDPGDLARANDLGIKYYFNNPPTQDDIKKMTGQEFSYALN